MEEKPKPTSIRFDKEHHEIFNSLKKEGRSVSWYVLRAVNRAIEEDKKKGGFQFAVNMDDNA